MVGCGGTFLLQRARGSGRGEFSIFIHAIQFLYNKNKIKNIFTGEISYIRFKAIYRLSNGL
nr:MAG TPA: hypothetical protein [Crassvirales sp.]